MFVDRHRQIAAANARGSEILELARRGQKGNLEYAAFPDAGHGRTGCKRFADDPRDRSLRLGTLCVIAPRQGLLVFRGGLGEQPLVLAR